VGGGGVGEVDADAFGTEGEGAGGVGAEVEEGVLGVVVAVHSCYKNILLTQPRMPATPGSLNYRDSY